MGSLEIFYFCLFALKQYLSAFVVSKYVIINKTMSENSFKIKIDFLKRNKL